MTREFDPQFFMREDVPVDGPLRELVGYGEHPPQVRWKDGARVAVQIVVNVEEGSEKTFAMGDGTNDGYHEFPDVVEGQRDLAVESYYEYGSRAGIWRLFRVFDARRHPGHALRRRRRARAQPRRRAQARRPRRRGRRPRLPLEQPLRDEPRRGARGDPPRRRLDRAHHRLAPGRLVLPRDEREHARARGRGGRLPVRLRLLQRRPAVLDEGARPRAPRGALRPRRERRALRHGQRLREPRALLRDGEGAPRPPARTTATTSRG